MHKEETDHDSKVQMYVCICQGDSFVVLNIKSSLSERGEMRETEGTKASRHNTVIGKLCKCVLESCYINGQQR